MARVSRGFGGHNYYYYCRWHSKKDAQATAKALRAKAKLARITHEREDGEMWWLVWSR